MVDRAPRLLMAGGGSGGHAIPALAVAEVLKIRHPDSNVLFVGTSRGVESRVIPAAGFALRTIPVIGLKRALHPDLLRFPLVLLRGLVEALRTVLEFRPDLVMCTGGFVSGPVGFAAWLCGRPLLLHESNLLPGLTIRLLSRFADGVLFGLAGAERKTGGRFKLVVGNPVRSGVADLSSAEARTRFGMASDRQTLLVIGGSQGARSINLAIEAALADLVSAGWQVLWQTGKLDRERAERVSASLAEVTVAEFIDEMPAAYRSADLALTRSGAMTLTELRLNALPAILVPLATSAENHQEVNARAMEREGWARVILQRELNGPQLVAVVGSLTEDSERLMQMSEVSGSVRVGGAAERIVDVMGCFLGGGKAKSVGTTDEHSMDTDG
jgi:UDP-N-acetylglucosamine--N-acetylmuramyl-(pentapeptide) pyrophosphoryl-undecaprenol N-acetylglucosamine transferase